MSRLHDQIDDRLRAWVEHQKMFFVATAPRTDAGHINCSPKGADTLRITGPRSLAYVDMPGSGIETIAHLRENGRILLMLCAFDGPPSILRIHGRGSVLLPADAEFLRLLPMFTPVPTARAIIRIDVTRISTSCGFGVPLYDFDKRRTASDDFVRKMTDEQLRKYAVAQNQQSIDGIPGLTAEEAAGLLIRRETL